MRNAIMSWGPSYRNNVHSCQMVSRVMYRSQLYHGMAPDNERTVETLDHSLALNMRPQFVHDASRCRDMNDCQYDARLQSELESPIHAKDSCNAQRACQERRRRLQPACTLASGNLTYLTHKRRRQEWAQVRREVARSARWTSLPQPPLANEHVAVSSSNRGVACTGVAFAASVIVRRAHYDGWAARHDGWAARNDG
jgi:hypothetical protein